VRWPRSLAFPDSVKEVSIVREGKRLVITPSNAVRDDFLIGPASTFPQDQS
jgi:antitoxin VapB